MCWIQAGASTAHKSSSFVDDRTLASCSADRRHRRTLSKLSNCRVTAKVKSSRVKPGGHAGGANGWPRAPHEKVHMHSLTAVLKRGARNLVATVIVLRRGSKLVALQSSLCSLCHSGESAAPVSFYQQDGRQLASRGGRHSKNMLTPTPLESRTNC